MSKKSKVKSYVRNGRVVKSFTRTIKDRVRQIGTVAGTLGGAVLGAKYGRKLRLNPIDATITGAALGSIAGSLPSYAINKNNDKAKKQLRNTAIGAGLLSGAGLATVGGLALRKYLKTPRSSALVSYNPIIAERNMMAAIGIKAKQQLKNVPKDIYDLDNKIISKYGMPKIEKMNESIKSFQQKASKPGFIKTKSDLLNLFDSELTPEAKEYLISRSRVAGINKMPRGDEIREKIFTATIDDIDKLYKSDAKALKNYRAINKAISDPNISPGEKAAYQAQLGKYADKFNPKVIIDRLRNLGFSDLDIKEMKERIGTDGLFKSSNLLVNFSRKFRK